MVDVFRQLTRIIGADLAADVSLDKQRQLEVERAKKMREEERRRKLDEIKFDEEKSIKFGFDSGARSSYEANQMNIRKLRESFAASEVKQVNEIPGNVDKQKLRSIRY